MTNRQIIGEGGDRRTFLAVLAAAAKLSLAGCTNGDDTDDGAGDGVDGNGTDGPPEPVHGERVPELTLEANTGPVMTQTIEQTVGTQSLEDLESLGVDTGARSQGEAAMRDRMRADVRESDLFAWWTTPFPGNLDPTAALAEYHVTAAGTNERLNPSQYASCEFTEALEAQYFTENNDERDRTLREAVVTFSEDLPLLTLLPWVASGAVHTDRVDHHPEALGRRGISRYHYGWLTSIETRDGEPIRMNGPPVNSLVHPVDSHQGWSLLTYSPLLRFDRDYQLRPYLADAYAVEDGAQTIEFSLRDATFEDGETITAADVKYTLELYNRPDTAGPSEVPYEALEIIDDRTLVVHLPTSTAGWIYSFPATMAGILPKHVWEPLGPPEPLDTLELTPADLVGSGPYRLVDWEPNEYLTFEPFEAHWNAPAQGFEWRMTRGEADDLFRAGELDVLVDATAETIHALTGDSGVYTESRESFGCLHWAPQTSAPPCQYREFRLAVSKSLNRRAMADDALPEDFDPISHATPFGSSHPAHPGDDVLTEITPSPEGDAETARTTLREAGWTWDDDGNLRYPSAYDLAPRWPAGSEPAAHPEEFPCISELSDGFPYA